MTLQLAISGLTGRMGRTLRRLIDEDPTLALAGGIDRAPSDDGIIHTPEEAGELLRTAEVLIDFSAPEFLRQIVRTQGDGLRGKAVLVGTTGLESEDYELLDRLAEHSPVLVAANFSVAVNLLLSLAEQAARVLGEEYDIEIVEAHHRRKEDAPSGTALALGEAVAQGRQVELDAVRCDGRSGRPGARPMGEIGFHAVRGGDVVGEHDVRFIGDLDQVVLSHRAADRSLFAAGALRAAVWLSGRAAGRYTMRDVLGLS